MHEIQSVKEYVVFQRVSTDCNKTSLVWAHVQFRNTGINCAPQYVLIVWKPKASCRN